MSKEVGIIAIGGWSVGLQWKSGRSSYKADNPRLLKIKSDNNYRLLTSLNLI